MERLARDAGLTPDAWGTAVFYSPGTHGWRISRTLEGILAGRTSLGAAFVAMRAVKPVTAPHRIRPIQEAAMPLSEEGRSPGHQPKGDPNNAG